eukprot:469317-Pyramimonas_sp.AAC.1
MVEQDQGTGGSLGWYRWRPGDIPAAASAPATAAAFTNAACAAALEAPTAPQFSWQSGPVRQRNSSKGRLAARHSFPHI